MTTDGNQGKVTRLSSFNLVKHLIKAIDWLYVKNERF